MIPLRRFLAEFFTQLRGLCRYGSNAVGELFLGASFWGCVGLLWLV